ncbi:MAG: hypothetical protein JWN30_2891 [Bacilli bacterium]|nr:hypothetical protein [Bacilli bacterium]
MKFYATIDASSVRSYMPPGPMMLPASSWARTGLRAPNLPAQLTELAADCGGFVATLRWGDYRYTPEQYVAWLRTFNPQWAATMDYCCEDEITSGRSGVVRLRQKRTTDMAWHFWHVYRDTPWAWVPTVQGWTVADYRRHARELRPVVQQMQEHYGPESAWRVGIGTLCRRASVHMIHAVVAAVSEELPGVPLHLWGIKLSALQSPIGLPSQVVSVDSAAWNNLFGQGRDEFHASGLTQRQYTYLVALPEYRAKWRAALLQPKQAPMLFSPDEAGS